MARKTLRRTPNLETLESREVMAAGGPSAQAQYMLEMVNLARTSPAAAAQKFTTNLDADTKATLGYYNVNLDQARSAIASAPAKQPLAWNDQLANAAQGHSNDMSSNGFQSHNGSNGSTLDNRLDQAGYTNRKNASENVFAYSDSLDQAMQAFMIDWGNSDPGHRKSIQQPDSNNDNSFAEIGIGLTRGGKNGTGPLVVTQNFGRRNGAPAQVLGIVYDDADGNNFYDIGEGRGDVTVTAKNIATNSTSSVASWDAGGYQMPLAPGTYDIQAKVGNSVVRTQRITVGDQNVKVDFNLRAPWTGGSDLNTPPAQTQQTLRQTTPVNVAVSVPTTETAPTVTFTPAQSAVQAPDLNDFTFDWIRSWTWSGKAANKG